MNITHNKKSIFCNVSGMISLTLCKMRQEKIFSYGYLFCLKCENYNNKKSNIDG